jgi:ornithine cyclodeaminase/alanine dehydrogenase-like protein (mu-crystallin family)
MTLLLNNADVARVLSIDRTIAALEQAYRDLATENAVCRPRIDIRIPTGEADRLYQWGTMEGGSATSGYFAIRAKSDVVYEREYNGVRTQEKYCVQPGTYSGIVLLYSIRNGEPLALMNDGYVQHMRVGGCAGLGVETLARPDAEVLGLLGSGGMARTYLDAIHRVRRLRQVKVFSPTREHREQFADEMSERLGLPIAPVEGDVNGLRIGTPEIVRWGMNPADMPELAGYIAEALSETRTLPAIARDVTNFRRRFSTLHFIR